MHHERRGEAAQLYRLQGIGTSVQREEHVQRAVIATAIRVSVGGHSAVVSHLHRLPASQLTMKADIVQRMKKM